MKVTISTSEECFTGKYAAEQEAKPAPIDENETDNSDEFLASGEFFE